MMVNRHKTPYREFGKWKLRQALYDQIPSEIDIILAERTGQPAKPRKIISESSMYKFTGFLLLALVPLVALADNYQVVVGWQDPTAYNPGDAPTYELHWRVAGGAETLVPNLTNPAATLDGLTADPGDPIEVQVRALNLGLEGPWTDWITATAGYPVTAPANQTGVTITVIRTGP